MADNEADESFQNLTKLITLAEKGLSESDTRAKIIDPLFKDCLGWTEKDIQREPYVNPGYLDYLFSIDGIKKFALEAKKTGSHFHIPKSLKRRSYRIDATITTDKNIKKAIEQAQRYCVDSGVRYGVVSNGHQFILFEAFRYGKSWRSTSCMVFRSLEDIKKNFTLFWNILSKDSVLNGSFKEYISRDQPKLKYERPLEKFHDKDSKLIRNYLSREVQPIINHIFQDIIDESQRARFGTLSSSLSRYVRLTGTP